MKFVIIFLIFTGFFIDLISISGKITDENGEPVSDVIITNDERGAISDINGNFYMNITNYNDSLLFHKMGYENKKIKINDLPGIIILKKDALVLDEYVVTSKRINLQELSSKNKQIIEIDEQEQNLASLITDNSNISLKGTKLTGETQEISILGHKTKHTLILLDGIPLNMSGSAFDLSSIPVSSIEKVEILENNASAIAGSGSVGGIINLITKSEERFSSNKVKISSSYLNEFGSFGYSQNRINVSLRSKNISSNISCNRLFSRNNFEYKYLFTNNDPWRKRENNKKDLINIFSKTGINTQYIKLDHTFTYQKFYKELPGQTNQLSIFNESHITGENSRHICTIEKNIAIFETISDIYFFSENSMYDNLKSQIPKYKIKGETKHSKKGIKSKFSYDFQENNLCAGFVYQKENFSYKHFNQNEVVIDSISIMPLFQENRAVFMESHFQQHFFPFDFSESFFLRYDNSSRSDGFDYDDASSWRIELKVGHEGLFQNNVGVILANAYSLPSFYDLFWKGGQQAKGNPELLPESSNSMEFFYKLEYLKNHLKLAYHESNIYDLIYWHPSAYYWKPDNLGKAKITNYTLESELNPFNILEIKIFWLRTIAKDRTNQENIETTGFYGKNLIYTPRSQVNLSLKYKLKSLSIEIQYQRTGTQWSTQDNNFNPMKPYELTDAEISFSHKIKKFTVDMYVSGSNIFDDHYEVYTRIPQPGFHWKFGCEIKYY